MVTTTPTLAPSETASNAKHPRAHGSVWVRIAKWVLPVLVLAASGLTYARYRSAHVEMPLRFSTGALDRGSISAKVTASGTLSALVTVQVGSQVSGRIETLGADFGSVVKTGQTIATIEPSLLRASAAQARANHASARTEIDRANALLVQAERRHTRATFLFGEGVTSKADLEAAEADLDVAKATRAAADAAVAQTRAALDQAELNLKYTKILSPIDGVVISRNVDVGQTVAAALQAPTIFTIAQDLTRMQVDTNVAEADVGKIHPGMKVGFTVDAYPARTFDGVVRQVRDASQTIQNVVTYDAVIDVDNSERLLKPGMTASVSFVYDTRADVLRVPNAAVRFKPDGATLAIMSPSSPTEEPKKGEANQRSLWVLRAKTPTLVTVRVGLSDGSTTEIVSGDVRDGDQAITEANSTSGGK